MLENCAGKKQAETLQLHRPVKVIRAESLGSLARQYTGVVEATKFSILAFKIPGTLTELRVQEGQSVRQGESIARINPYDYELQYQTAQANYKAAASIYRRTRRLFEADALALQDLEIAEADYIRAKSALDIAKRTLDYTDLKAPFNGFIEKRYADNFEEIRTGQPIVRLVNPDQIEIRFILPETNVQLLELPKKLHVLFDSWKRKWFAAEIKEYVYSSDGTGIPVTLRLTDQAFAPYRHQVFPGFSCKIIWEIDNTISDKFVIPASALLQEGRHCYVWIVDPQTLTIHKQAVSVLAHKTQALVLHGLNPRDLIVTAGTTSVREGQQVSIMQ